MKATTGFVIVLSLVFVVWMSAGAHAAGVPEPGITLYGQVLDSDGNLVTEGRLVWTLTRCGGTTPWQAIISTDLAPISDGSTTFSYWLHFPAEMPALGMPISANFLPATEDVIIYAHAATLDGAFTWVTNDSASTTTYSFAERGKVERVNLSTGVGGPPDQPSLPSPADGETLVPLDRTLDWADAARAETYDIYLWRAGYSKPSIPTASGLTTSQFRSALQLRADATYVWQVVARNAKGNTEGAQWTFRTAYGGDLQKLLEYLLGKRSLSFEEQALFDLNDDGNLDIADFVLGLKRSTLSEQAPDGLLPGQASGRSAAKQAAPLIDQRTVALGADWADANAVVSIALPAGILPTVDQVAGMNLRVEADPSMVQFDGIRPGRVNEGEELYFYSPDQGVMNVVYFADPIEPLKAVAPCVIWFDLKVTLPHPGISSRIYVRKAALSDINGISAPDVLRSDGYIYSPGSYTSSRNWELYH